LVLWTLIVSFDDATAKRRMRKSDDGGVDIGRCKVFGEEDVDGRKENDCGSAEKGKSSQQPKAAFANEQTDHCPD
jgi:hypothetical protein